jgi:Fic family protein
MFQPKFTISYQLMTYIERIAVVMAELENRRFPELALMEFQRQARELSSHTSTAIEGNELPLTVVKQLLKSAPDQLDKTQREVVNYNLALTKLNAVIDSGSSVISRKTILPVHKDVTKGLLPKHLAGKYRLQPVFLNNPATRQVVFLPPDHQDVEPMLQELLDFLKLNFTKMHPIVLAGILHKQFVLIHPFLDGNGRTTRLLTKWFLAGMGIDTFHLFSFENFYNKNVSRYFSMVGERGDYTEIKDSIDFTPWLEYFAEGILDEMMRVSALLDRFAPSPRQRFQPHHLVIRDRVLEYGYITDREYGELSERARAPRALDLKTMVEWGVLERHGKGKATYYTLAPAEK